MSKSKKSHNRAKYGKESPGVLITNQLQQLADDVPSKKARFFTSKQRKQEQQPSEKSLLSLIGSDQNDAYEDRENVPRVPPLKLRLKAANAAALSIGSFSNKDDNESDNTTISNGKVKCINMNLDIFRNYKHPGIN